jgi:hypothetical protein
MPFYTYINPDTKESIDIVQSINENHVYIDKNGLEWQRVFTVPEVNTHGTLKADTTEKQFSEYTRNQKGSMGDLYDRSAELSEKRKKIYGKDPVKNKYYKDWSKKRKGKVHPKSHLD